MSWVKQTLASSVGGKAVVAATGLALVGFVVAHLSGNLLVYAGPEALSEYAQGLRKFPALLWFLRIGLLVMAVAHVTFAIKLSRANAVARPVAYQRKQYARASWSSRNMLPTGLILLAYVIWHLADFTFRKTFGEYQTLGEWDVYQMLVMGFSHWWNTAFYIVAMVALGIHLSHGISSVFQTLGFNNSKYQPLIRRLGPTLGILLSAAYISIPVSVMLGIVK